MFQSICVCTLYTSFPNINKTLLEMFRLILGYLFDLHLQLHVVNIFFSCTGFELSMPCHAMPNTHCWRRVHLVIIMFWMEERLSQCIIITFFWLCPTFMCCVVDFFFGILAILLCVFFLLFDRLPVSMTMNLYNHNHRHCWQIYTVLSSEQKCQSYAYRLIFSQSKCELIYIAQNIE